MVRDRGDKPGLHHRDNLVLAWIASREAVTPLVIGTSEEVPERNGETRHDNSIGVICIFSDKLKN
jgi:hypothetical protein